MIAYKVMISRNETANGLSGISAEMLELDAAMVIQF
jgi:hypothetical protein